MHLLFVVGSGTCPFTLRIVSTLAEHNISFVYIAITSPQMKQEMIEKLGSIANNTKQTLPILILLKKTDRGYDIFEWKEPQDSSSMVQEVIDCKLTMKTCKNTLLKMLLTTVENSNKAIQMCKEHTSFVYCL